jgi:hypothetical protein
VPFSAPTAALACYAGGGELPWLAERAYLALFPVPLWHAA